MRADERREQILATAEEIFAAEGFERTSIADICTAARIGRGTLYQYFENKHSVFRTLVAQHVERIKSLMRPFAEADLPPPRDRQELLAMLSGRLERIFETVDRNRSFYLILLREAPARHAGAADLAREVYYEFRSLILRELRDARAAGLLRWDDLEHLASFVIGGVVGSAVNGILNVSGEADVRRLGARTAELIVRILEGGGTAGGEGSR